MFVEKVRGVRVVRVIDLAGNKVNEKVLLVSFFFKSLNIIAFGV